MILLLFIDWENVHIQEFPQMNTPLDTCYSYYSFSKYSVKIMFECWSSVWNILLKYYKTHINCGPLHKICLKDQSVWEKEVGGHKNEV